MSARGIARVGLLVALAGCAHEKPPCRPGAIVARIDRDADALAPLFETRWARDFLGAAHGLPPIAPRTLWHSRDAKGIRGRWLTDEQAKTLAPAERATLVRQVADEELYYETKYGSPLAYARPLELLGRMAGVPPSPAGTRLLDFGYGTVGHLRTLARLGADVVGLDVDPFLRAIYAQPEDQGEAPGASGPAGKVTLVDGRFPEARARTGEGFDLILSKNTLKRGYVHPERPVEPRMRMDLGAPDAAFLRTLFELLKPGGRLLIYNLAPAQAPSNKPYIPWADGRSPFDPAAFRAAGFAVEVFDRDDTAFARRMAKLLGWDKGDDAMDLDHGLFATWTLVRRPVE
jgi:SAM-dependent methyltransferase